MAPVYHHVRQGTPGVGVGQPAVVQRGPGLCHQIAGVLPLQVQAH